MFSATHGAEEGKRDVGMYATTNTNNLFQCFQVDVDGQLCLQLVRKQAQGIDVTSVQSTSVAKGPKVILRIRGKKI